MAAPPEQNEPREKPQVLRETDEAARALARALLKEPYAALASSESGTQWPLASRVSLALDASGVPLILISRLSAHYAALESEPRCCLLVGEPVGNVQGDDPLRHPRMSVQCRATKVPAHERQAAKAQFIERHSAAQLYADFADFDFWRLMPERASLNAGFARAYALTAQDLL
jgi:heme iron utilization protein